MYMFLPFLIAFGTVLSTIFRKKKFSYVMWFLLLAINLLWFKYHATDPLDLSF
ncbi:DUF5993 family protein [Pantoea ananatis]|uniref:DUF5993 family protein n=1 Tax=Pantoea ananas TaxID=553 RepID=UPI003FA4A793